MIEEAPLRDALFLTLPRVVCIWGIALADHGVVMEGASLTDVLHLQHLACDRRTDLLYLLIDRSVRLSNTAAGLA
jgi:hypothetical protein